ncbi:MAG: hypothetical protein LBT47_08455 [Deltaproteobacteria bacterium]|nr:hypothetical protein [Deltaproteobacteria bacterium]
MTVRRQDLIFRTKASSNSGQGWVFLRFGFQIIVDGRLAGLKIGFFIKIILLIYYFYIATFLGDPIPSWPKAKKIKVKLGSY